MRYVFRFGLALVLGLALVVGCSDENGEGGSGGTAGIGGMAGEGGTGGNGVACVGNVCPCAEAGIRLAIAEGGGPFTFDCDGPTTVVIEAEIVIDNDVILDGEGDLTVDGNEDEVFSVARDVTAKLRGFSVMNGCCYGAIENQGNLTLTNSMVSNSNGGLVGGISNYAHLYGEWEGSLILVNSTVSGNSGGYAGGIFNEGMLTLTNSTVSDNTGSTLAGGIINVGTLTLTNSTVSGNSGDRGGGIWNGGTLTLTNSTVSGNTAEDDGGGIYANGGTATLTNSTVSGNTAEDDGGGLRNSGGGPMTLINSTVSGNSASSGGGVNHGGPSTLSPTLTLIHSTVSGNSVDGIVIGPSHAEPVVTILNTVLDNDCTGCGYMMGTLWTGVNVTADDLKLGPLQDNGGPTMTHALGAGSVAIDQIPAQDCVDADGELLTTDQRGELRPETGGTLCDVGAFEVQP